MVHMNIIAEAWRPHVMQSSMVGVGRCPPLPHFTIQSLTMMIKHHHIGETNNVGHQQAGSAQSPTHCPYLYK